MKPIDDGGYYLVGVKAFHYSLYGAGRGLILLAGTSPRFHEGSKDCRRLWQSEQEVANLSHGLTSS